MTPACYGLPLTTDLALPELDDPRPADDQPPLAIVAGDAGWSGSREPPERATATTDGRPWSVERGRAGDLLMRFGADDAFHLDAAATRLTCAPARDDDAAWRRVLLDTALTTVALARGLEALHASAIERGGGVVAIAASRGEGKTTLVRELVGRGHAFVADDVVTLGRDAGGAVLAHPAPPVIALRGDGEARTLARMEPASREPRPLQMVVLLDRTAAPGTRPALTPATDPGPALLAHALSSGTDGARRLARLDILATLAAQALVVRLTAGSDATAAVLADLIES